MKIQKQQAMRNVLIALTPLHLASIYLFGWRYLAVLVVVLAVGLLAEWLMARRYNLQVTESLYVSCALFALSLPPAIPLWIAALGIAFGVVFGKMVFGGFGRNVFNPAITARAFVYISFGVPLTARFVMPQTAVSYVGGIATWLTKADAISAATPLVTQNESLLRLFLGNISGSFGETSALLIILGGLYLIYKKSANWKIVVASFASFLIMQTIFWGAGLSVNPLYALLSGSFLLGAFFMITDPVSASQSTDLGRYIYGSLFGIFVVLIRTFSNWTEGVTFAILLANMFAPLIDYYIKDRRAKRRAKA
ncbi:MAG: RnfABCDGE type electron transport complex subunit D [Spirochaetales bacterium]|nr:RnfABCDGE type electron transport complex subunit D [Spirochaetales bacterium]